MDSDTRALIFATVVASLTLVGLKLWRGRGGRRTLSWPMVAYVIVTGNALFFALWYFKLRD